MNPTCSKKTIECPRCGGDGLMDGPGPCSHGATSSHSHCSHNKTAQHDN